MKEIFKLSNGNAYVESRFSMNKEVLIPNLKEDSLVDLISIFLLSRGQRPRYTIQSVFRPMSSVA